MAQEKNDYAWVLLTCRLEDLRDPQAALPLAVEANEMTGHQDAYYLDALALAYSMTGDMSRAIEYQRKAVDRLDPNDFSTRAELLGQFAQFHGKIGELQSAGEAADRFLRRILPPDGLVFWPADRF